MCIDKRIDWYYDGEEDQFQWTQRMRKDGEYGAEICQQIIR